MPTKEDLIESFAGYDPPEDLLRLLEFEQTCHGYYSEGFELTRDDKSGLRTWSEDDAFLAGLLPFAQADGTGSFYALWVPDGDEDLGKAPVIVFGSEGGVHVVANDVRDLLRLLTFDAEPMVDWDAVTFYKDPDQHEPSVDSERYRRWLQEELGLAPVDDPEELVGKAHATWDERYQAWMKPYLDAD